MNFFIKTIGDEVGFYVQAAPNSSHNRVMAVNEYHGQIALKVAIAAPPTDHKANLALVRFLAEYLALPRSNLSLIKGHTSKLKLISCAVPLDVMVAKFREKGWIV